jgi:homocysteine S-methyltransferase
MGSELERRGLSCTLPLWSAQALIEAPEQVRSIHTDHLRAGATVLTAATFRTSPYSLAKAKRDRQAAEFTNLAVQLAREAVQQYLKESGQSGIRVAGSMAPLEDCYHPERCPADGILFRDHERHARRLNDAGVDLILVETQNSQREAQIATEMALNTGLPVWTSLLPKSPTELISGDSLLEAALVAFALGVDAVLVNCCAPDLALAAFQHIRKGIADPDFACGLYPNLLDQPLTPDHFAAWGLQAVQNGAAIIGGCCGSTAAHLQALHRALSRA